MTLTVLVTGDRAWTDWELIQDVLLRYPPGTRLVHGAARGADRLAGQAGERLGFEVHPEPADWLRYRKAAGPIRNQKMLDDYEPDIVHAFHDDLAHSKGTADMVRRARARGVRVEVHEHAR